MSSRPVVSPHSLRAWLLASRPQTLTAAVAPVLVGTALSWQQGALQLHLVVATLLGASLLQIGSNFANDVFDYEKGADTGERLGPPRAVQQGLVSPAAMKRAMLLVLVAALFVGVYLTYHAGWPIVAIGVASLLSAVAYTGGPYPLGYHGLGDLFVLIFFGFVAVGGTCWVHLGQIPPLAWGAGLAVGLSAANILVVNNLRDRHTDVRVGKRTLVVRFGRRFAELQYLLSFCVCFLVPVAAWWAGAGSAFLWLTWLLVPLAVRNYQNICRLEGKALNLTLVQTARFVFLYGVSFSLALSLPRLLDFFS